MCVNRWLTGGTINIWYRENRESVTCSVVCDSLWLHGLQPTRLLCPWNSPGKNTGVGSHSLLQGIFLTSNLGLLHCRQTVYSLSHWRIPMIQKKKKWVKWWVRKTNRTVTTTTVYISPFQTLIQSLATLCQAFLSTITKIFTHIMPLGGHTHDNSFHTERSLVRDLNCRDTNVMMWLRIPGVMAGTVFLPHPHNPDIHPAHSARDVRLWLIHWTPQDHTAMNQWCLSLHPAIWFKFKDIPTTLRQ